MLSGPLWHGHGHDSCEKHMLLHSSFLQWLGTLSPLCHLPGKVQGIHLAAFSADSAQNCQ